MIDISAGGFEEVERTASVVKKTAAAAAAPVANALGKIGHGFIAFHQPRKLRGRPGLNIRSQAAGMGGARQVLVEGNDLNTLEARVFWGPQVSKYVRTHEYGAVIKPVRARFLRFKVDGRWVMTKKVTIPARLGWFDTWDDFKGIRDKILDECRGDIVKRLATK